MMPSVDAIMRYEEGEMEAWEILELFSGLVATGMAWTLQGTYGRTAMRLIEAGYLDRDGAILKYPGQEG